MSSRDSPPGELFIVSAPSGAGKTTLIRAMMNDSQAGVADLAFSVSHTTRPPRGSEVAGQDYHFVDVDVFERMIEEERFLEWAKVHSHYYGTSLDEVLPRLARGIDVVLDIDVQGAEKIRQLAGAKIPRQHRHSILVLPPGYEELRQRLVKRNLDEPEEIRRRLLVALEEVQRYQQYEYVIINDDVGRASRVLAAIILEKRHRQERMHDRIAAVLKDFGAFRD